MANLSFKALHLYTAPFSGCSARVRIAAHLKSIPLIYHNIDLSSSQQSSASYLTINPNASVPSLIVEPPTGSQSQDKFTITQSPAILDFLEAHFPTLPLLPGVERMRDRARVIELTSLVACDIQPPQSSRIRRKIVEDFRGDGEAWAKYVHERGFGVYETFVERARLGSVGGKWEGRYSIGDEVTLADVFLVPAVQIGLRVGIELEKWPLLKSIVEECWKLEAFRKGGVGGHGRLLP
jgi:maleylacetoacetate isomerase